MKHIPDFKTSLERQQWFVANADYFTAITRRNMINERVEFSTLVAAEAFAREMLLQDLTLKPYIIYAVVNDSDSFVKTVLRDGHGPTVGIVSKQ